VSSAVGAAGACDEGMTMTTTTGARTARLVVLGLVLASCDAAGGAIGEAHQEAGIQGTWVDPEGRRFTVRSDEWLVTPDGLFGISATHGFRLDVDGLPGQRGGALYVVHGDGRRVRWGSFRVSGAFDELLLCVADRPGGIAPLSLEDPSCRLFRASKPRRETAAEKARRKAAGREPLNRWTFCKAQRIASEADCFRWIPAGYRGTDEQAGRALRDRLASRAKPAERRESASAAWTPREVDAWCAGQSLTNVDFCAEALRGFAGSEVDAMVKLGEDLSASVRVPEPESEEGTQ
jgi:hypothetical protein